MLGGGGEGWRATNFQITKHSHTAAQKLISALHPLRSQFKDMSADEAYDVVMNPDADPEEVLSEVLGFRLTREHVLCLKDGQWLSDNIINWYMQLLQVRKLSLSSYPVHCGALSIKSQIPPSLHFWPWVI